MSRITIRQAVRKLVDQHLLYTKQGKGTFVNAVKIRRRLPRLYSFSEDMRELGFEPSSKVLEQAVVEADQETAELLALPASDGSVNRIVRVRMANNIPILIERSFIPHYLCPDLLEESYEHTSLYETLTGRYRLEMDRAEETYEVRLLTVAEAKELMCRSQPGVFHSAACVSQGRGARGADAVSGAGGSAAVLSGVDHARGAFFPHGRYLRRGFPARRPEVTGGYMEKSWPVFSSANICLPFLSRMSFSVTLDR